MTVRAGVLDVTGTVLVQRDAFPEGKDSVLLAQPIFPVMKATVHVRAPAQGVASDESVPLVLVHPKAIEAIHLLG